MIMLQAAHALAAGNAVVDVMLSGEIDVTMSHRFPGPCGGFWTGASLG